MRNLEARKIELLPSFDDPCNKALNLTDEETDLYIATVKLLNNYFTHTSEPIRARCGIIDNYIGDAIMAFWTPPFTGEREHALLTCQSALDQRSQLAEFRATVPGVIGLRKGLPAFNIRMGLATGEVTATWAETGTAPKVISQPVPRLTPTSGPRSSSALKSPASGASRMRSYGGPWERDDEEALLSKAAHAQVRPADAAGRATPGRGDLRGPAGLGRAGAVCRDHWTWKARLAVSNLPLAID